jgi:salicylate hydroxylase
MHEELEGAGLCGGNANQWADEEKNARQFGYDADEEVEKWWREEMVGMLGVSPRL